MRCIKINNLDNVAVALTNLAKGEEHFGVVLSQPIAKGHKFALLPIAKGQAVIKYGNPIGTATVDIEEGSHVHAHNLKTALTNQQSYQYQPQVASRVKSVNSLVAGRTVNVFERANGGVGIRNEVWIVPTVGCVNLQAKQIASIINQEGTAEGLDGVFALTHPYGCSQTGEDHLRTKMLLKNIVLHPNAGGVLVLGLGCENNVIEEFRQFLGEFDNSRIRFIRSQDVDNEVEEGVRVCRELCNIAKRDVRVPRDISCLNIGLKCGGSDGLSGITANPLLGMASDSLCMANASCVLTEVPEMFGAEQLLMNRAVSKDVFNKIEDLINNFKQYYISNNQPVYENPSPGNKDGGISTLEDKSLGCTQKSGSLAVQDVILDGQTIKCRGLSLLNGPGNDMVAVTNLGSAGCHMVLFTTGRGTPLGGFVPTVKVATNSDIFNKKGNWLDFNAGEVLECGFEAVLQQFLDYVISVANGEKTKAELYNFREIALFKSGVTL